MVCSKGRSILIEGAGGRAGPSIHTQPQSIDRSTTHTHNSTNNPQGNRQRPHSQWRKRRMPRLPRHPTATTARHNPQPHHHHDAAPRVDAAAAAPVPPTRRRRRRRGRVVAAAVDEHRRGNRGDRRGRKWGWGWGECQAAAAPTAAPTAGGGVQGQPHFAPGWVFVLFGMGWIGCIWIGWGVGRVWDACIFYTPSFDRSTKH